MATGWPSGESIFPRKIQPVGLAPSARLRTPSESCRSGSGGAGSESPRSGGTSGEKPPRRSLSGRAAWPDFPRRTWPRGGSAAKANSLPWSGSLAGAGSHPPEAWRPFSYSVERKASLGKSSAPDDRLRLSRATGKSLDWQAPESPRSMHAGDEQTCAILGRRACCWQILPGGSTWHRSCPCQPRHPGAARRHWKVWRGIGSGEGPIEQIVPTAAESQRIVAARPLCRLQYRVESKSSAWDLPQ